MDKLYNETTKSTVTVTNESFVTVLNSTNETIASSSLGDCAFSGLTFTSCVNKTNDWAIPATNYTVYSTGQLISTDATCTGVNGGASPALSACGWDWNCTYTYSAGNAACDAANLTIAGQGDIAEYFDLIILALVITIIIGLLLVVMSRRSSK